MLIASIQVFIEWLQFRSVYHWNVSLLCERVCVRLTALTCHIAVICTHLPLTLKSER